MSSEDGAFVSSSPIALLPDELLGAIFLLNSLKVQEVDDNTDAPLHDRHATLLATSAVCKRWREVAFSYPVLWGNVIDFEKHSDKWIEELLRRSKSSLIDVGEQSAFKAIHLRNPKSRPILQSLARDRSKLRTLSLNIRISPFDYICQNFLQHPAPNLEYFNLITSSPFPEFLHPDPLFMDQAPRLREFHLQRCLVDFRSVALHHLTSLSVMDIISPGILSFRRPNHPLKVAPTVRGWLEILKDIPSLQYLTLHNAITRTDFDRDTLSSLKGIDLPNLIFLTIGAELQDGAVFLNHVSIPGACGIRLRLNCQRSSLGKSGEDLLTYLGQRLSHWPHDSPDRYLQAKALSGSRIHFGNSHRVGYVWDMTEPDVIADHKRSSSDPLTWLVLSFNTSEDTLGFFDKLLSLYQPTYATTTVLVLWLDEEFARTSNNDPALPAFDVQVLHSFTSVKALNLLERSPLYLLPLFQSASSATSTILPSLRSLRLTKTNFEDEQRAAYFTVLAFLFWRTHVQAPVAELQVIDGKINAETVDSLERNGNVKIMQAPLQYIPVDYLSDGGP
ncbi:unnamed protein product [Cyclocybe aegerita]|uniref:F-box domain-containing protein n=1 Tax=Cyclocybe aegerita TaxID=1973307 RepID=A0A8S0W6W4_CYCAE|nr:unnamed protein product [Cyclocybe aegerita]